MSDDKKIIIDEDWKSQVEREKEEAAKARGDSGQSSAPSQDGEPGASESSSDDDHDPVMPPASFEMLLTTLATEALVALGAVPHPMTGHQHSHPNQAKYLIDTIEVLKHKTAGNLSEPEGQMLESLLHQLKLVFVEITTRGTSPRPSSK